MEIVKLKLSALEPNNGQIPGLPVNPRQWTRTDIDQLAKSLTETPELFEARPLLVVPHEGKYVILGGNLRYEASKQNKAKEVPAIVFPESTPVEKMKELVVKDNGAFGDWDFDALANEWDDLPLADWGVPAWNTKDVDLDDLDNMGIDTGAAPGESETGFRSFTFVFANDEGEKVAAYIEEHGKEELQARIVELCQKLEAK